MPAKSEHNEHLKPTCLAIAISAALSQAHVFAAAPPTFSLDSLTAGLGVTLAGEFVEDHAGTSASAAGDINDDGIGDIIIGAPLADPKLRGEGGESYVVFGGTGLNSTTTISLGDLDGSDGFALFGAAAQDNAGASVDAAGDINGDGIDDLIIGAAYATVKGDDGTGAAYVVFGGAGVGSSGSQGLSSLDGSNGFALTGKLGNYSTGKSVSRAGDINDDTFDDVIVGGFRVNGTGESYVVFGGDGVGGSGFRALSSLDGMNGFTVPGAEGLDYAGRSVSDAGDFNGDGFDDVLIGAWGADTGATRYGIDFGYDGRSYVVFGGASAGSTGVISLETFNGNDGLEIRGIGQFDRSGYSVSSVGDVNGDGLDDIIIGAPRARSAGEVTGAAYVVFGRTFGGSISLASLDGSNGFAITGRAASTGAGYSVASAGDVNGDGVNDLIVTESFLGDGTHVVFGGSHMGSSGIVALADLDGSNGFSLTGHTSTASGIGDVNGDGMDDLLLSSRFADPDGREEAGEGYIVFMPLPDSMEADEQTGQAPSLRTGESLNRSFHPADTIDKVSFRLFRDTTILIETANNGTKENYDTVLELYANNQLIAINDDIIPDEQRYSRLVQTLSAGDYEMQISAKANVTIPSYSVSLSELDTCDVTQAVHQFTLLHNQFTLLSLPCQPSSGTTIDALFGDDIEGGYLNRATNTGTWVIFTWDAQSFSYVDPGPEGSLEPGQGFWMIQAQDNGQSVTLDLPQDSLSTVASAAAGDACSSFTGCIALPLSGTEFPINPATNAPRLDVPNLLGNPYDQSFTLFDDLRVTTTAGSCAIAGGGCTLNEATLPENGGADVVANIAFTYNAISGAYDPITSGNLLSPWQGFWMFELPSAIDNNPNIQFPYLR